LVLYSRHIEQKKCIFCVSSLEYIWKQAESISISKSEEELPFHNLSL
jgi:hypothetical protein